MRRVPRPVAPRDPLRAFVPLASGALGARVAWTGLAVVLAVVLPVGCVRPAGAPSLDLRVYGTVAVAPFRAEGFLERYGSEIADQLVIELLTRDPSLRLVRLEVPGPEEPSTPGAAVSDALTRDAREAGADLLLTGSCVIRLGWVRRAWLSRQAYASATILAKDTRDGRVVWAGRQTASAETQAYSAEADTTGIRQDVSDPELRETAISRLAAEIAKQLGVR